MTHIIERIWKKVNQEERVSKEETLELMNCQEIIEIGKIANFIKEKKNGKRVTYVFNRQINPTNICVLSCKFCDFATKKNKENAYAMTLEEILSQCSQAINEVHIVGGLYAEWPFEYYLNIVKTIHENFPQLQIKAYTAVEIDFFSRREHCSIKEILLKLKEAGLVCLPGGGAEVFSERVRKALFPFKIGANRWLEIHQAAHELGIRSNATLLYGHIETHEERIDHMQKLRDLQDKTKGFLSFIPLAFQPGKGNVTKKQTSSIDDLKTIAIARIFLDNFDHIKSYWVTMGEETASMALNFGADDLDGTIGEEKIMHAADAKSPSFMAKERLEALIRSAKRNPMERDALYNIISEKKEESCAF
ncbi:MAG: aminofutalosine synthase MqnE [Elusimicrobia bacterium RIFCSPLOWO2_02_FULL_39_32]|nr:MAG: aminofutalosine synthase MqnE [Elusimicrobia bacterium GWA2_38_7]OGR79059.1 MAG: aminofutalosine synthase MqnE [Elusimicrobia bacterium RIFCSPHIGHO2_02_FULL_39_36]OGR92642.1 MAG: aminofutalosine synthase MqnE [Elusimicrobia bacterium RIFCSPLOWO2_02_FULL_39_32]OGR99288.1 MAG: aminofutalosine synthase MqnE [Elusimicrobia bacterium RIFCSPLOWO2_12_FULL_39_28]